MKQELEKDYKDELYCMWFKCPFCGETDIAEGFKYCPDCGKQVNAPVLP